ncbi:hypothetical protein RN96_08585 [Fusobacterium polymorphum]|uniref:DUF1353 domain-containing protein n=1 Tax=Fusobacterium nucleatum subsp. polymorphum TaxID=76857 RepID=A0A2B7YIR3_FUSNP|nr:DUF1353 domain-containing protein [Fusobacterium polymorphum]PGH21080.1 hypothetical protein RN96_08585 [Fusobacterium polymorphum]
MPELCEFDLRFYGYKKWILKKKYSYKVNNRIIEVPENFITDLASTPKILWNIFEPAGENYTRSSLIHDYLYSKDCKYIDISRKEADQIFLEIMKERGVPFWKRYLMFIAVRVFGGLFFQKE